MKSSPWSMLLAGVALATLLPLLSVKALAAPVFVRTNMELPAVSYSAVAWGDLNNDSRPDLIVTGANASFNPISRVMQNSGSGAYTEAGSTFPGVSSGSVAWGDLNNDGKLDLLLTGFAGINNSSPVYISEIWRNNGNGLFEKLSMTLPEVNNGAVAWGDFDSDGRLDFLLTGFAGGGGISQVWRNQGNGSFSNLNAGLTGVFYSAVARADFDNDGSLDILITGTTNGFLNGALTQIWRNLGHGNFTNLQASLPAVSQGSVAAGDFDNDGNIDILLTGYSAAGPIAQIWRNQGNASFTKWNVGLPGVYQSSAALGDFDNDGLLDVLLSGTDAASNVVSQVWRNVGNGVFTNLNEELTGVRSGSSTWGDFDNDGKLDILLTGFDATNNPVLHLFRNNTAVRNSDHPHLANVKQLPSGNYQLSFNGKIAFGYSVMASTNLNAPDWSVLGPAQEASPGTFTFVDSTNSPVRFYRVSTP